LVFNSDNNNNNNNNYYNNNNHKEKQQYQQQQKLILAIEYVNLFIHYTVYFFNFYLLHRRDSTKEILFYIFLFFEIFNIYFYVCWRFLMTNLILFFKIIILFFFDKEVNKMFIVFERKNKLILIYFLCYLNDLLLYSEKYLLAVILLCIAITFLFYCIF